MTEPYKRHLLSGEEDLGGFYVDVFDDGSIHVFDREPPTEEQVSLNASEVQKLFKILPLRPSRRTDMMETGAASLHISLSGGVIEVSHGSDCTLLGRGVAEKGDWNKLISFLRNDLNIEWQVKVEDE